MIGLDDAEKVCQPGAAGKIDIGSVETLCHHDVRVLGERAVNLVVAMRPRFDEVTGVN